MRYYSIMRPVMPGSYPKKTAVQEIKNFDEKTFCEEIGREAWGYIDYSEELAESEAAAYELVKAGLKTYWGVTTSFDDRGRVVSNITSTVEAAVKPENTYKSTSRKDIYVDWFESREAAENHVKEAREA